MTDAHMMRDPRGRRVSLEVERWKHIISGHPEMVAVETDIVRAVESPSDVLAGRGPGEEWFYLEGAGPSRWLKVVVVFDRQGRGRIITAFARRRKP